MRMRKLAKWVSMVLAALGWAGWIGSAAVADEAATGRQVAAKCGDAVVKVQLVIKSGWSFEGRDSPKEESKAEVTGTVIDPSGLTIVSLSTTDPASYFESMMGDGDGMKVSSELTDVKIRFNDGKEIPAKIVLRDKDLDLAFVRPAKKIESAVPALDLKDASRVDVLDQVVVLGRLGKVANRSLSVCLSRVEAVIEKPRKFYVVEAGDYGVPVLSMEGKPVGILLMRTVSGDSRSSGSFFSSTDSEIPVVVPAEDILSASAQVPDDAPKE